MKERRERLFEIDDTTAAQLRKLAVAGRSRSAVLLDGTGEINRDNLVERLGHALDRPVQRIALDRVVSRYIGETEKNLARCFVMAERAGAVPFFDEADALFGKRTEVRDDHDRHVNQQAEHLLALVEQYDGLVLLATNRRTDMASMLRRYLLWVIEVED